MVTFDDGVDEVMPGGDLIDVDDYSVLCVWMMSRSIQSLSGSFLNPLVLHVRHFSKLLHHHVVVAVPSTSTLVDSEKTELAASCCCCHP